MSTTLAGVADGAVPGPRSREHFLDAQRRNRRKSWRAAAIAVPAVILSGIPLCVLATPIVAAPFLILGFALHQLGLLPPAAWDFLEQLAGILPAAWSVLWGESGLSLELLAVTLVLPGAVVMLLAWLVLRLLFRKVWVGSAIARLGARPADPQHLEERQLVNIVEELAVAAAVAPPRVLIIDSERANAAAVGLHFDDSAILVSTGLVRTLDRAETQAYLGHLVASIGNGDLRIASTFVSVFQAWGLLFLLIDAPFSREARAALGEIARAASNAARRRSTEVEERCAMDLLLDGADQGHGPLERYLDQFENGGIQSSSIGKVVFVDLPLMLTACIASITARAATSAFIVMVFGPPIGALWRSRRRLADAGAVELTRQPDALASALDKLGATDVEIPGGQALSLLFPYWPREEEPRPDVTAIVEQVPRLHLDPANRMADLRRLGATYAGGPRKKSETAAEIARDLVKLLGMILLVVAILVVLGAVSFAGMGFLLLLLWWLLEFVLATIPGWIAGLF
jgi:Zn-dependent protease with chaperone function